MERKSSTDQRRDDRSDLNKEDHDGLELAQRAQKALDPSRIPLDQLTDDPYLGEESVREFLQRPTKE